MKVAMFYGGQDIRLAEVPDPVPGPGEVLVRIVSAGICGSDLHDYRSDPIAQYTHPFTGGHELAGMVAQVGSGVTELRPGDAVAVEPLHLVGCGRCRWCHDGHHEACPTRGMVAGTRRHSTGFGELDLAPAANCLPLPEGFPLDAAAILDVYACAVHAGQRAPAGPGDTVVVIGTGPIALATIEMYRALGAGQVIACGRRDEPLATAQALGASIAINSTWTDPAEQVNALTGGHGAQVVIEAVGGRSSPLDAAAAMVAPNGTLGIMGLYAGPQTFDPRPAMRRQITIRWINSYGLWNGVREFGIALEMVSTGRFHPLQMITHRFPLDQIAEGFQAAANKADSGAIKVLIQPEIRRCS